MLKVEYLTQSALIKRGWSLELIEHLLGAPDLIKSNPLYKSAAPMKLFEKKRIIFAEKKYHSILNDPQREIHKKTAQKMVLTKTKKLVEIIESIIITITKISILEVEQNAINNYCQFKNKKEPDIEDVADEKSARILFSKDLKFKNRLCVNYIRHNLTNYDESIIKTFSKTGKKQALNILRDKIYNKIAEEYPNYGEECNKQLERRKL